MVPDSADAMCSTMKSRHALARPTMKLQPESTPFLAGA
jgi:hypothetical protein